MDGGSGHLASLGRAADASHGRENDAPVAPLQLRHERQVVADPEAPDRFLLQKKSRTEPLNQKLEWFGFVDLRLDKKPPSLDQTLFR